MQIKDGKFSLEGTVQVAGMGGEPQKAKDVATIGIECVSIVPDDRLVLIYLDFEYFFFKLIFFFNEAVTLERK